MLNIEEARTSKEHNQMLEEHPEIAEQVINQQLKVWSNVRDVVVIRPANWINQTKEQPENTGWENYMHQNLSFQEFDRLCKNKARKAAIKNSCVLQTGEVEPIFWLQESKAA